MAETTEKLTGGYLLLQDDGQLKLGLDAALLADFTKLRHGQRVCELGCGAGAVLILLASRYPQARIDAVELQESTARLARENVRLNRLEDRVSVRRGDLREIGKIFSAGVYDAVVCNPPYLKAGSGKRAAAREQALARMEIAGTIADFCAAASRLLKPGGRFYLVYRPERLADLLDAMRQSGIEPKILRFVQEKACCAPCLLLAEGRKGGRPGLTVSPPLLRYGPDGKETRQYRSLFGGEGQ